MSSGFLPDLHFVMPIQVGWSFRKGQPHCQPLIRAFLPSGLGRFVGKPKRDLYM
jgi:hypothetical protein